VLSIDYCKYPGQWAAQSILATAAVDGSIRVWDLRQPLYPLQQLNGHRMGVKRLRWSPFQGSLLASCGYDMTVRLWDAKLGKCLSVLDDHREFVYGLDWSLFEGGQLASCSWDRTIQIVNTIMGSG
jgi:peroxin-7